jgi:hypothetical protein
MHICRDEHTLWVAYNHGIIRNVTNNDRAGSDGHIASYANALLDY